MTSPAAHSSTQVLPQVPSEQKGALDGHGAGLAHTKQSSASCSLQVTTESP